MVRIDQLGGPLNRLYYSGKHHHHGVNLHGLIDPRRGELAWISDGLPGSTHDLTAARAHEATGRQGIPGRWRHADHPAQGLSPGPRRPTTGWSTASVDRVSAASRS